MKRTCLHINTNTDENSTCEFHPTLKNKLFTDEIEKLNIEQLQAIKKGTYKYKIGIIYCDLFTEQGELADHCYHVLKYVDEII